MSAQSGLSIFEFDDAPVRTLMIDDNPWFVGKDVCRVLELQNTNQSLGRLADDERKDGVRITDPIGRDQATTIINEPGVYRLVFTSRQDAAERFKHWLAHEVLPALRKTGRFEMDAQHPADLTVRDKINMISEARRSHGKPAARALWAELGLPMPSVSVTGNKAISDQMDVLQEFMAECTVPDAAGRVRAFHLKNRYDQWARMTDAPMMTTTAFGRMLSRMGFDKTQTNVVHYIGFRLVGVDDGTGGGVG